MATPARIVRTAAGLRDRCRKAMAECAADPETYGDPGDAVVTINGNDKNVLSVLYVLDAIGIPDCKD